MTCSLTNICICFFLITSVSSLGIQRVPYQFHPKIHTLGNVNIGGWTHATIAPFCTWAIDQLAYKGEDVRTLIKNEYAAPTGTLDFGSGTGFSSTDYGISVDTSRAMLFVAKLINSKNRHYVLGNAENVYIPRDIVTCMFLLHEVPREYRLKIIENAIKNANKRTIIVDIHEMYKPSKSMIAGEPFVFDYLAHAKIDITGICNKLNKNVKYEEIIPGHVQLWIIE